jgi:hypothetical protein
LNDVLNDLHNFVLCERNIHNKAGTVLDCVLFPSRQGKSREEYGKENSALPAKPS